MKDKMAILIIEADPSIMEKIEQRVRSLGYQRLSAASPNIQIDQLASIGSDIVILGPSLGIDASIDCVHKIKIIDAALPVLTACEGACISGKPYYGPFEDVYYIRPDFEPNDILRIFEIVQKKKSEIKQESDFSLIIGESEAIRAIREQIQRVAVQDVTVLISGETGTGKELIARSVHYHSLRKGCPFVKIGCGTLPDELVESEVFGYQEGAFTGADRAKQGRIELANKGTLFLDEIGDLPLPLQVKFLQLLEEKIYSRLGGADDKAIDTRILAATNADLSKMVQEGVFRKDLYYRLNVVNISSPPLRERKGDISILANYFLNKTFFELNLKVIDIPDKVIRHFEAYHWPGNVRELENMIRRAIAIKDWEFVFTELNIENKSHSVYEDDPGTIGENKWYWSDDMLERYFNDVDFSLKRLCKDFVSEAEQQTILDALRETNWNRKKAAQLLHVSYKTLLNRIIEFDLKP